MASPPICSSVTIGGESPSDDNSDHDDISLEQGEGGPEMLGDEEEPKKKKTRGRVKIGIKLIDQKQKRSATFHKRKSGLMKKGFELSVLTGAEVLVLAAWGDSVFSYSTKKLQRVLTSQSGQELIHHCLRTPAEDVVNEEVAMRWTPEGYVVRELSLPKNEKRRRTVMETQDDEPGSAAKKATLPSASTLLRSPKSNQPPHPTSHIQQHQQQHQQQHHQQHHQQQQQQQHAAFVGNSGSGMQRDDVTGVPVNVMVAPPHSCPQPHMNGSAPNNAFVKSHLPNRMTSYNDYQALTNRLVYLPQQQMPGGPKQVQGQALLPQMAQVAGPGDMPGVPTSLMPQSSQPQPQRQENELFGMMPAMIL